MSNVAPSWKPEKTVPPGEVSWLRQAGQKMKTVGQVWSAMWMLGSATAWTQCDCWKLPGTKKGRCWRRTLAHARRPASSGKSWTLAWGWGRSPGRSATGWPRSGSPASARRLWTDGHIHLRSLRALLLTVCYFASMGYLALNVFLIQTDTRSKRMLFIRTKHNKQIFSSHFYSFNCCLSVVLELDKGDSPWQICMLCFALINNSTAFLTLYVFGSCFRMLDKNTQCTQINTDITNTQTHSAVPNIE